MKRAEELVDLSLTEQPKEIRFLHTKSTILLKQERYAEALPLLEQVLPYSEGDQKRQLHVDLAKTYTELNRPEMAERHRSLATSH